MADQDQVVESKASPEAQKQAEQMGWIPPTRFKGDPEKFVDADTYIKRGEEVLPIVREQNRRLHTELDALKATQTQTQAALKAAQTAIDQMEERHTVATQKAVTEAREALVQQLAAASEAGDHQGVALLTDKLTQANAILPEVPAKKEVVVEAPAFTPPPELVEWNKSNPWFGTDKRKTALALAVAQELREAGETGNGVDFYDKVAAEVDKTLGIQPPRGDKVEGARNGGDGEFTPSSNRGKGYAALPTDAKSACDAESRRFVGEGKKYKTIADWRTRYAEIYFGG